jgi:hypothetical protein
MKNKKGTDKILSIYWFTILVISALAIVYMVAIFYGRPYDVRAIEGNLLLNKVSECLMNGSYLRADFQDQEFKDHFLDECNLTFKTEDSFGWRDDQYYISLPGLGISAGNENLAFICSSDLNNNPFCIEKTFYALSQNKSNFTLSLFVSVRKTEKNFR